MRTGLTSEALERGVLDNLACLQGRYPGIATPQDWYMALAYSVRDRLLARWVSTVQTYVAREVKLVCYLSAEFLIGPQLANNLANLGIEGAAREAMRSLGQDLDALVALEEEPGLGNGGLGRLAACFLDSLATLEVPAIGYGIRYEFGIFDQLIRDGWQVEKTDKWLALGNPWEIPRPEILYWRTTTDLEVDFVIEHSRGLIAVEVKAGSRPGLSDTRGLKAFRDESAVPWRVALDELADLAATLADEPDDVDVGPRVARQHAEQHALADAAAGEDADPLAPPDRQEPVDRPDAGLERLGDALPVQDRRRGLVDRLGDRVHERAAAVEGSPEAVDDAAEERLADRHRLGVARRAHLAAAPEAGHLTERHEQQAVTAEADHLGGQPVGAGRAAATSWIGLAISLESLGRRSEAVMAYRRALTAGPIAAEARDYAESRAKALE